MAADPEQGPDEAGAAFVARLVGGILIGGGGVLLLYRSFNDILEGTVYDLPIGLLGLVLVALAVFALAQTLQTA